MPKATTLGAVRRGAGLDELELIDQGGVVLLHAHGVTADERHRTRERAWFLLASSGLGCGAGRPAAQRRAQAIDLTGRRFGRWVVMARLPNQGKRHVWACRCDCGTARAVKGAELRRGKSQSCGCLRAWFMSIRRATHRLTGSRAYTSWAAMRNRCQKPKSKDFRNYGARGIRVDLRWTTFEQFYADMGEAPPRHTLDRIDNDGPYAPGNCRWARAAEQVRNRRPRRRRPDWSEPGENGAAPALDLAQRREWWEDVADPGGGPVVDPDDPANDLVDR